MNEIFHNNNFVLLKKTNKVYLNFIELVLGVFNYREGLLFKKDSWFLQKKMAGYLL